MKEIDLGQSIGILANLGVIAGIIFLGIEINQANQAARSQARTDIATSIAEFNMSLADSPELAELFLRGLPNPASLTALERLRVTSYMSALLRLWENSHYQYRNGLFDEVEFFAERETWKQIAQTPLFVAYFCGIGSVFSPAFSQEMENLMQPLQCPAAE